MKATKPKRYNENKYLHYLFIDIAVSEEQCGWNNTPVITSVDRKYFRSLPFLYSLLSESSEWRW